MPGAIDVRTLVVKLLKAHHLRYKAFGKQPDPETGVEVTLLTFCRDQDHNPKAFFDAVNETGLQYKKLTKDPNATEITCELWPRGMKGKVTEMREDSRKGVGTGQGTKDQGESGGSPGGTLRYLEIPPSGETNSQMIQSVAKELVEAGCVEEAAELLRIGAGGQDWNEFRRKVSRMFHRIKLHQRPEIRQMREQIANEIVSTMGLDSELFSGLRGSDLEKQINEVLHDNIDLVLDTRGIADSVLRRTASCSSGVPKIAKLKNLRRGVLMVGSMGHGQEWRRKVNNLTRDINIDIDREIHGSKNSQLIDVDSPLMVLLAERNIEAAYLMLLGE
jgi:hypothetical protein